MPLRRITGVAPRFAVAMRSGGGVLLPMIRAGVPCAGLAPGAALACLRATTRRFLRGPALIAPIAAPPGGTIRVAVRMPGRAPGEYRLVALVGRGGDARGVTARITVR